jgi:hypothetical protein
MTSTKDYTLENIYAAALFLNIPNEFITVASVSDSVITFSAKTGAKWDALVSKSGKVRVKTLRPAK